MRENGATYGPPWLFPQFYVACCAVGTFSKWSAMPNISTLAILISSCEIPQIAETGSRSSFHNALLSGLGRAIHGPMPVSGGNSWRTFSAIGPYEFPWKQGKGAIGPYDFPLKFIWTSGSKSLWKLCPKGPFRTKKTTALESVVFCYCRSCWLSIPFFCFFSSGKQAFLSSLCSVFLSLYRIFLARVLFSAAG